MKSYSELTRLGKIRRMRQAALQALKHYPLNIQSLRFLTIETNIMFQVFTKDGGRYVLRIYSDEETTIRENQAEIFWLKAIIQDTDIKVTEPVARRDGEYISVVSQSGVPGPKRCVLFNWVPGRTLVNYFQPKYYFKLGQVMAKLHEHAFSIKPLPAFIQPKKWDKVFYYPDEPVLYNTPEYSHLFSREQIALLDDIINRANIIFKELYSDQNGQILIHGDIHYWNVHVFQNDLTIIDFEDVMLGYPVQDIAVTLSYGRQKEEYADCKAAFQQGYCEIRPFPAKAPSQIGILMAARSVNFINYVARIDRSPQEYIDRRCEGLMQLLSG